MGLLGSLFGGGGGGGIGNSTSRSESTTINETSNVTQGAQDGGQLYNVQAEEGANINLSVTDAGSVESAFDFGSRALDVNSDVVNKALTFAENALSDAFGLGRKAVDVSNSARTDSLTFAQRAGDNALKFAFDAGRPDAANTRMVLYVSGGVAALFVIMSVINNKTGKKKGSRKK